MALVPRGAGAFFYPHWQMDLTFHLVDQHYFNSLDPNADYLPEAFARDGFIHCTDGADEMAGVANAFYKQNHAPQLYVYIDKSRVSAPIQYEDPQWVHPHIYGALNREAIVAIRPAGRDEQGNFLPPEML